MNHLDVGLDKGRSKTNLAVAHADGHLLLEAQIEHFDQIDSQPIADEGLLHLIAQHLAPFKAHPLSLPRRVSRNTPQLLRRFVEKSGAPYGQSAKMCSMVWTSWSEW